MEQATDYAVSWKKRKAVDMWEEHNFIRYFWVYENDIPKDLGFEIFGVGHLGWLLLLLLLGWILLRSYLHFEEKKRQIWEYVVGGSMTVWIVLRTIYIACIKEAFLYELPLHLCSITGILCLLHARFRLEWMGQVLYEIGLPGAVLALIFPDWNRYPAIHFITIEGFFFHAGIVWYVIAQLYSHGIVLQRRRYWQVVVFLLSVGIPVFFFNRIFKVNYMFINRPSEGSPLELLSFMKPWEYRVTYIGMLLLCMYFMLLGYEAVVRKRKNRI